MEATIDKEVFDKVSSGLSYSDGYTDKEKEDEATILRMGDRIVRLEEKIREQGKRFNYHDNKHKLDSALIDKLTVECLELKQRNERLNRVQSVLLSVIEGEDND